MAKYFCPQCGCETDELHEGYCEECLEERNSELQEFLHREAWWNSLSESEKDFAINSAVNPCFY